jgi:hypothetical protein
VALTQSKQGNMNEWGVAFSHRGAAQAACLVEKLEKECKNIYAPDVSEGKSILAHRERVAFWDRDRNTIHRCTAVSGTTCSQPQVLNLWYVYVNSMPPFS